MEDTMLINKSFFLQHAAKLTILLFIIIIVFGFSTIKSKDIIENSTHTNKDITTIATTNSKSKSNYDIPVSKNLILSEIKLSLNELPKNEIIYNLFTILSIKNNTHTNNKGLLMEPILPQFKKLSNSLHIVSSYVGTTARGNHKHDISEVLVLMQGYWHLRVHNNNIKDFVYDFKFDNGEPVAIVIEPHVCHALRNSGIEDAAWAAAYYINGNDANKPNTDRCVLMD